MQKLGFLIVFYLLAATCQGCRTPRPKPCPIAYRCSDEEAPVWTTNDNTFCEVFRNECLMLSSNCNLKNEGKPEYRKITKQECQALCRELVCLAVFQPVCGSYNGVYRTFGNDCEMKSHICTTGQTYSLYRAGACPQ